MLSEPIHHLKRHGRRMVEFCKQHLGTTEDSEVQKQDFVHTTFGWPGELLLGRRAVTQANADSASFRC